MNEFTFGSLFSGIGGIDLGLERSGMTCKWQVENDPFCTKVLAKHWPNVTRYGDVRTVGGDALTPVDLIAGGWPCQPHSLAGQRKASEDERDLWPEFYRVVCELRPTWVLAENVVGVLSSEAGRFFGGVLRDLARAGYDAEWHVLSAHSFGAPHERKRVFIIAYPHQSRWTPVLRSLTEASYEAYPGWPPNHLDSPGDYLQAMEERIGQSAIFRGNDGVASTVDRLERLGNAVVPQLAEYVGRCIREAEQHDK